MTAIEPTATTTSECPAAVILNDGMHSCVLLRGHEGKHNYGLEPDQDTEPDPIERSALGAALAAPDGPLILPLDEWLVIRELLRRLAGVLGLDDSACAAAEATAAEKNRIAQVARQLGAHYHGADGQSAPFDAYLLNPAGTAEKRT